MLHAEEDAIEIHGHDAAPFLQARFGKGEDGPQNVSVIGENL